MVGFSEQVKLLQSKVAIIGAGGLGGTVLELLARMGIGKLIVADKDIMGGQQFKSADTFHRNQFGAE